jgi:hypothetical protein
MDKEVERFISNAEDYWLDIRNGNSSAANRKENANRKIFNQWAKDGSSIALLSPLLDHPSNSVKLAAAAYLIKTDVKENAVSVLSNLVESDTSLISTSASAVLRLNMIA